MPRLPIPAQTHRDLVERARHFRQESTLSEAVLWQALRRKQLDGRKFRRQQPLGPFIVDFFCASEQLIVEVDGSIHASQIEADAARQALLEAAGYRVVRLSVDAIDHFLSDALATIQASWQGG